MCHRGKMRIKRQLECRRLTINMGNRWNIIQMRWTNSLPENGIIIGKTVFRYKLHVRWITAKTYGIQTENESFIFFELFEFTVLSFCLQHFISFHFIPFDFAIGVQYSSSFHVCWKFGCTLCVFFAFIFSTIMLKSRSVFFFIPLNCISYLLPVEFFICFNVLLCDIFMHSFNAVKMQRQQQQKTNHVQISAGSNVCSRSSSFFWYIGISFECASFFSIIIFILFIRRRFAYNRNVYDNQWTHIEVKWSTWKYGIWTAVKKITNFFKGGQCNISVSP